MNDMSAQYPAVRIVVTGSRWWKNADVIFDALKRELADHGQFLLGVGDCPKGADMLAREWAGWHLDHPFTQFHAMWHARGKAAGPLRNHFMIDMFRPRLVLAFFRPDSRGTKDCAEYADLKGIEVRPFYEGFDEGEGDGGTPPVQGPF